MAAFASGHTRAVCARRKALPGRAEPVPATKPGSETRHRVRLPNGLTGHPRVRPLETDHARIVQPTVDASD